MQEQFAGQTFLNLETYRKNRDAVRTPVWFVQEGDVFYFRTTGTSGKVKRLLTTPLVRIVPCEVDGKVIGVWVAAVLMTLNESEEQHLLTRYNEKYAVEIAAITNPDMQNKLRANQGFAVRLSENPSVSL